MSDRELLLWQLADLLGQYARGRQWWRVHVPEWSAFEERLEADR
jgi:hypothetical protein